MGYFVVGDIHGCLDPLEKILYNWDKKKQQFVQLGDMIDRGPDSLGVLKEMMKIKEQYNGIILKGNHEEMFLEFLDNPDEEGPYYFDMGGLETVQSFLGQTTIEHKTPRYIAEYISYHHADVVRFIKELPLYYEQGKWVFVHAGVNLAYQDWRYSSDKEFLWIRNPFIYGKNYHPKIFVFGHTPTRNINGGIGDDIWVSECGTKIGIDGAFAFGGQLNALQIDGNHYKQISVKD